MITVFALLSLIASIICALLGLHVYFLNRKALLNRLFMMAILLNSYWAFTEFMMRQATDAETANLWIKIGFLWPFFVVLLFHFTLVFTESAILNKRRDFLLLYLPAAAFAFLDLTTDQISGVAVKKYWGYTYSAPITWLGTICIVWGGVMAYSALLLWVRYYRHIPQKPKKQQIKYVTTGIAVPILTYTLTQGVFPVLGISVPELGVISCSLMSLFIAYAIWKHDLFSLDPAAAAENIISTMPDSLVLADPDGKILRVNNSVVNFLGYPEKELIGKSITELFAEEKCGTNIIAELAEKQEISNYETKYKTKAGEEKAVVFSGSLVRSKRGQGIGFTCIVHDLTRRKKMEEQLVKAERFASIGELAGMIGHDLRNPLTSIKGATYYLKTKYASSTDVTGKEMFATIERSIEYSNKIINDLLDYSRETKLEIESVTPKQLMKQAFSLIQVPQNIQVIDATSDSHKVRVDVGKMCRVFVNIAMNAFDAMPDGGTLNITNTQTENSLIFSFSDTGLGMSKETLSKLWVPLFTTKAKGMGFGLAICKRVVEEHGGEISAESTIGKGTTITVTVPVEQTSN